MNDSQRFDFLQKEYQEAARVYALGVQTGQDLFRQYLFGTGVLGAFFAAATGMLGGQFALAKYVLLVIPAIGITASIILISLLPHYRRHLDSCCFRCEEIEKEFEGKLFTAIGKTSREKKLDSVRALQCLCAGILAMWAIIFIVSLNVSQQPPTNPVLAPSKPGK